MEGKKLFEEISIVGFYITCMFDRLNSSTSIGRRAFLKAAGVSLALPMMESISKGALAKPQRRMVCIGNEFGMYPGAFWPEGTGRDYEITQLLKPLAKHRKDFTLFSHLDHGLKGGHFAIHGFLTGVNAADARNMPEGGISIDQRAAEFIGSRTRFPALTIGSADGLHGGCQMSWTRTGTRVPPIPGPRELFRALFIDDSTAAKKRAADRIRLQGSILDAVLGDAKSLKRRLNKTDSDKLEEYFHPSAMWNTSCSWTNNGKRSPNREHPSTSHTTRDWPRTCR